MSRGLSFPRYPRESEYLIPGLEGFFLLPARPLELIGSSVAPDSRNLGGVRHEPGTEILLDVKLRAASPQFDGQTAHKLQATDQGHEVDPFGGRLLRDHDRR